MSVDRPLLPASRPSSVYEPVHYGLIRWTLGRGSVIWKIWPAVLFHTLFAAVVVYISLEGIFNLEIPSVMLTVLGVVIGFVISYRASSGYDRYWMGRTAWGDVMRNARTLSRLIWFHVPLLLTPKTAEERASGKVNRPVSEMNKVMAEKRMALDLIEGFAFAVKHHLRGETGIYYEDLYHLVRPMHEHLHTADDDNRRPAMTTALPRPRKPHRITIHVVDESDSTAVADVDPVVPAISVYGTFDPNSPSRGRRSLSRASHASDNTSNPSRPLLPSHRTALKSPKFSRDLIPFAGLTSSLLKRLGFMVDEDVAIDPYSPEALRRRWKGPISSDLKLHPAVAAGGESLPLGILRCLSDWFSVLEDRDTVPGTSLGTMIPTLGAFEDSLSVLERILSTPLPFVYAVHIRHTVWIYLFFLPFQLVVPFGYSTIPGVAIAAFIYLGFLAAGEEIEQPFGYDDNDLDLDLFCQLIVHEDIQGTKRSPCLHAYFDPDSNE